MYVREKAGQFMHPQTEQGKRPFIWVMLDSKPGAQDGRRLERYHDK